MLTNNLLRSITYISIKQLYVITRKRNKLLYEIERMRKDEINFEEEGWADEFTTFCLQ